MVPTYSLHRSSACVGEDDIGVPMKRECSRLSVKGRASGIVGNVGVSSFHRQQHHQLLLLLLLLLFLLLLLLVFLRPPPHSPLLALSLALWSVCHCSFLCSGCCCIRVVPPACLVLSSCGLSLPAHYHRYRNPSTSRAPRSNGPQINRPPPRGRSWRPLCAIVTTVWVGLKFGCPIAQFRATFLLTCTVGPVLHTYLHIYTLILPVTVTDNTWSFNCSRSFLTTTGAPQRFYSDSKRSSVDAPSISFKNPAGARAPLSPSSLFKAPASAGMATVQTQNGTSQLTKPNVGVYTDPEHKLWVSESGPSLEEVKEGKSLKEGEVTVGIKSTGICG